MAGTPPSGAPSTRLAGRLKPLGPVAAIALSLAFVVCWYTPAFLYANNVAQFPFSLVQVLPVLALAMLAVTSVLVLPAVVMPAKVRRFYAAAMALTTAYLWVQGFLLLKDYGLLDGDIDLPSFSPVPIAIAFLAIVGVAAAIAFTAFRPTILFGVFIAIVGVHLVHFAVLLFNDPKPAAAMEPSKVGELYELGSNNVIILLLDSLQSDIFEETVERRPSLKTALDGFTFYPNAMGVAPTTYGSLPAIHSSQTHAPGTSMREFFDNSIGHKSFLTDLADSGVRPTVVNAINGVCPDRVTCLHSDEMRQVSGRTRIRGQAAELLDLALFRLAPPELKAEVYNGNRWRLRSRYQASEEDEALQTFTKRLKVGEVDTTVKWVHLFSTHTPATRRADCSLLDEPIKMTREPAVGATGCALSHVADLIERLKHLGVYDETSIVLFADHGYRDMPSRKVSDEAWAKLIGRANPLVAVKRAGATGPMNSNDAALQLTDIGTIVCTLARACRTGPTDWEAVEPDRVRRFLFYEWFGEFWNASTLEDERRFEVRGRVTDPSSWKELPRRALPIVSSIGFDRSDRLEHFGYGWGDIETTGVDEGSRWALGPKAFLRLRLPEAPQVRVELDVGTLPEHAGQSIRIRVNGRIVTDQRIAGSHETISFVVPRSVATLQDPDSIVIRFSEHREEVRPGDFDGLAVRFDELRIAAR